MSRFADKPQPRVIFDKTAALANVKRHDYLPFGEELSTGQGMRTPTLGYGASDGIRQKFTSQERDNETGLDYMHARYFASAQGRFILTSTQARHTNTAPGAVATGWPLITIPPTSTLSILAIRTFDG